MNNKLIHSEETEKARQEFKNAISNKEEKVVKLINKMEDEFDIGDEVETRIGFDVYKYIEEIADYDTLFIPKGTIGIIESSGWNMNNNFDTTFDITLMLDGSEIDYCVKEQSINKYVKKR